MFKRTQSQSEAPQNPPSLLEQAKESYKGWASVRWQGAVVLLTGAFIDAVEPLGLESIAPSAAAIGGVAIINWAQNHIDGVYEFMDENQLERYELFRDTSSEQ